MTILTAAEFTSECNAAKQSLYLKYWPYNQDYSNTTGWFDPNGFEGHCRDAWLMYQTTTKNAFAQGESGILLLGGGIRYEQKLLRNFGTATVTKDRGNHAQTVSSILRRVTNIFMNPELRLDADIAGSILADGRWSPLLNDAFILGGIHSGATFHLAEPKFDAYAAKHHLANPDQLWANFFIEEDFLWQADKNSSGQRVTWPRVFSREALILKAAGYRAVINPTFYHQGREYQHVCLFFTPPPSPRALSLVDLPAHLEPMLKFQRDRIENPDLMLQTLSEFIFGNPEILLPATRASRPTTNP